MLKEARITMETPDFSNLSGRMAVGADTGGVIGGFFPKSRASAGAKADVRDLRGDAATLVSSGFPACSGM